MKSLTVISGKGGTGKTTVAASLAVLADNKVLADCDVDAADLHLVLQPQIQRREYFQGGKLAVIDPERCTQCGLCHEMCRFDAIPEESLTVQPLECEGCGVCVVVCPEEAITLETRNTGEWFISDTPFGPLTHARLGIGQGNSGLLVSVVRRQAEQLAREQNLDLVLIDGPPGIGCPVISSVTGTDRILAITEPTLSAMHDLERILALAEHFGIPASVAINKHDLNPQNTQEIEQQCEAEGISVLCRIPYDDTAIQAVVQGQPIVHYRPLSPAAKAIQELWDQLADELEVA